MLNLMTSLGQSLKDAGDDTFLLRTDLNVGIKGWIFSGPSVILTICLLQAPNVYGGVTGSQ